MADRLEFERMLREGIAASGATPLDDDIIELVVSLNLLGFPTYGSCVGHEWEGGDDDLRLPFVSFCSRRMPSRFEGEYGDQIWNDTRRASKRERRYFALLAWQVYRPVRDSLNALYEEFCRVRPGVPLFAAAATWRGVLFEPREAGMLWDERDPVVVNARIKTLGDELVAFGAFLARRMPTA